jgi:hypothetical protein
VERRRPGNDANAHKHFKIRSTVKRGSGGRGSKGVFTTNLSEGAGDSPEGAKDGERIVLAAHVVEMKCYRRTFFMASVLNLGKLFGFPMQDSCT